MEDQAASFRLIRVIFRYTVPHLREIAVVLFMAIAMRQVHDHSITIIGIASPDEPHKIALQISKWTTVERLVIIPRPTSNLRKGDLLQLAESPARRDTLGILHAKYVLYASSSDGRGSSRTCCRIITVMHSDD